MIYLDLTLDPKRLVEAALSRRAIHHRLQLSDSLTTFSAHLDAPQHPPILLRGAPSSLKGPTIWGKLTLLVLRNPSRAAEPVRHHGRRR